LDEKNKFYSVIANYLQLLNNYTGVIPGSNLDSHPESAPTTKRIVITFLNTFTH